MTKVVTGLENLINEKKLQDTIKGNIGVLCHSASIDSNYQLGLISLQKVFGERVKKLFGPQHGFVTDVQDNMVETKDYIHPYFNLPVHSLYSHTRIPTDNMLDGIDTVIVDLQDVGTRVYTYIWTLSYLMEKCAEKDINVVVLDRPNPVGGNIIEGNVLEAKFASFVGRYPIPQRHAMTLGEFALFANKVMGIDCHLEVIPMSKWSRHMYFRDTKLPWVPPSPNLPTMEGALTFVGTVLFEGTNVSEGRGTTRSLEVVGHPNIEPYSFNDKFMQKCHEFGLEGFVTRPIVFNPTFNKHHDRTCGGLHIHPVDYDTFRPWAVSQLLCSMLYQDLKVSHFWNEKPYEYEFDQMAIDFINGTDTIRNWIESHGQWKELMQLEKAGHDKYLNQRADCLIYE